VPTATNGYAVDRLHLLTTALEAAANAVVITDSSGTILWVNPAFTTISGYTAAEAIGKNPRLLKSGRHDRAFYGDLWKTIQSGATWRGELTNRRKDGIVYHGEQTITPVRSEDGTVTHFIAMMNDVTARKSAEAALRATHEKLRQLLEHSPAVTYTVELAGDKITPLVVSDNVERLLGVPPAEATRYDWWLESLHPDDRERVLAVASRGLASEGGYSTEYRIRHKDGRYRWIEDHNRVLCGADGQPQEAVGVWTDITERKRAEDELRQQREARYQSEKLADMGTLLAGVAHELNNPLAVVIGYATLLRSGTDGAVGARARKIVEAAERCVRIVRNFLALARQHPPERGPVKLNQVVLDAVELLAYPLRMDNVEVSLDLADDLPPLSADAHQLHQVVVNLITNAHHALRDAPAPRHLTLGTRVDRDQGRVVLTVRDSGPGIPLDVQSHIFEPFFTTKAPGQGTGLGLPITRGIVETHEGRIRVESAPGQGATFVVELPLAAAPPPAVAARGPETPRVEGRRILVVDDEPDVATILDDLLTCEGHTVEQANDGVAALAKLDQRPFDLVVSDVRMPRMDGRALYEAIGERMPGLLGRLVFMTGDTLGPRTRDFLEQTGVPTVSKPFNFEEVRRVVARSLQLG
jgi:nitrogen fixation negative regulator NifL